MGKRDILEAVQNVIIAHASTIRLTFIAEDEKSSATMADLLQAINLASPEELQDFLKSRSHGLPYDDGYIIAKW